jgi:RNA polymerase sigma factor (sigma-70 family)
MLSEQRLLEQWHSGDEEALFSLLLHYYNDLYKYGLKFTGDVDYAKDIVNNFFLHVWENRIRFSSAVKLKAYMIISFRHFLITQLKATGMQISDENIELSELPYEDYIIRTQCESSIKSALHEALKSLSPRQKELVMLRYFDELSYEEIAEKTSLTVRTVYNKLHIAIRNLRSNDLLTRIRKSLLFFTF